MNKQQIKQILEEVLDIDDAVEQILALDKPTISNNINSDEYKILSFTFKNSDDVFKLKSNNTYNGYDLHSMLHVGYCVDSGHVFIQSVKRLSDGTIFTLDDRVQLHSHDYPNHPLNSKHTITKFELINNQIRLHFGCNKCTVLLKNAVKLDTKVVTKTSLFKTEDGVDVFEGTIIWYIDVDDDDWSIIERSSRKGDTYEGRRIYPFSTKQAAENYVKCNKPCLSFNDVWLLNPSSKQSDLTETRLINKSSLTKLVKSKLN